MSLYFLHDITVMSSSATNHNPEYEYSEEKIDIE